MRFILHLPWHLRDKIAVLFVRISNLRLSFQKNHKGPPLQLLYLSYSFFDDGFHSEHLFPNSWQLHSCQSSFSVCFQETVASVSLQNGFLSSTKITVFIRAIKAFTKALSLLQSSPSSPWPDFGSVSMLCCRFHLLSLDLSVYGTTFQICDTSALLGASPCYPSAFVSWVSYLLQFAGVKLRLHWFAYVTDRSPSAYECLTI